MNVSINSIIRPLTFAGLVGCSSVVTATGSREQDASVLDVVEERVLLDAIDDGVRGDRFSIDVNEVAEDVAVSRDTLPDTRLRRLRVEPFGSLHFCDKAADIFYVAPSMYVLCTRSDDWRGANRLFFFDPAADPSIDPSRTVPLRERYSFPDPTNRRSLNVFAPIRGDWGAVTANDGFYLVNVVSAQNVFVPFPPLYNTGGGAVFHGGMLYIATANQRGTNYEGGTVLEYELQEDGTRVTGAQFREAIPTSQINPTGMVYLSDIDAIAVLNSGSLNPPRGVPTVDLISTGTGHRIRTTSLNGNYTASRQGRLALIHSTRTSEEEIVTASADGSRQVRIVTSSTPPRLGTVQGLEIFSINVGDENEIYFTNSEGGLTVVLNSFLSDSYSESDRLFTTLPTGPATYWRGPGLRGPSLYQASSSGAVFQVRILE